MTTQYQTSTAALEPVDMAVGDNGNAVSHLQSALQSLGYYASAVDGQYGAKTANAVAQLQRHYGLEDTGSYSADTWYALSFWVPEELGWAASGAATSPGWTTALSQGLRWVTSSHNKAVG